MAQGQFYPGDAQSSSDLGHVAVQRDPRLSPREHLDLAPDEADDADAERLAHRLFGGETGGVARKGIGEAVGVGALVAREEALIGSWQALEQAPHAGDLDGVDADAGHAGLPLEPHSTVTVFARLRGWSTSCP